MAHWAEPLPEGLPVRRGDYSVRQRHRRFPAGKLHRLYSCIAGCPFNVPRRLNKEDNRVYKCTPYADRVSGFGLAEPACVKTCPTGAIHFGTKKEMLEVAEERVAKVKKRGYANAGIYNPPGVGETHVMYGSASR